jgi:hypothetical protein
MVLVVFAECEGGEDALAGDASPFASRSSRPGSCLASSRCRRRPLAVIVRDPPRPRPGSAKPARFNPSATLE